MYSRNFLAALSNFFSPGGAKMRVFWRLLRIGRVVLPLIVMTAFSLWAGSAYHGVRAQGVEPQITIVSPKDGEVVTANAVPVILQLRNWTLDCTLSGTPNKTGTGHWHLLLDKGLVNMICDPVSTLVLQNVKPGKHILAAVPAQNDHEEMEKAEVMATFDYQPANPLPPVRGLNLGKPSVSILSPKNGATVSGHTFSLVFDVRNFRLSCDLLGRPKVDGTGHWHVNVDTTQGPMMGMMTMLAMGCTNSFEVPLAGIKPGTHKFFVLLVDNLHAPFSPAVEAGVTVNVKK
jgi:hypothetical protein